MEEQKQFEVVKKDFPVESVSLYDRVIEKAISSDSPIEQLEKLLELKLRDEANESRKSFFADMVLAQNEMPIVPRDKKNDQTNSRYSSYEKILQFCKPVYSKYGFSVSFSEGTTDKADNIRVIGDVMHRDGHTKQYYTDVPIDDKGIKGSVNKTQTHAKGSSLSYGKSYLIRMIFNIPTGDDDDGNAAGGRINEVATGDQLLILAKKYKEAGGDPNKISTYLQKLYGVETPEELTRKQAAEYIKSLEAKIKVDNVSQ